MVDAREGSGSVMSNEELVSRLCEELVAHYEVDRSRMAVVFSPYRICPLGAHIDHQGGHVTAMALDCGTWLAFAPLGAPEVRLRSQNYSGEVRFRLDDVPARRDGDWGDYVRGAVLALQQHYRLTTGLAGITQGRVSEGGLSSHAFSHLPRRGPSAFRHASPNSRPPASAAFPTVTRATTTVTLSRPPRASASRSKALQAAWGSEYRSMWLASSASSIRSLRPSVHNSRQSPSCRRAWLTSGETGEALLEKQRVSMWA
ncbi:MAG: hypothetical protein FJ276_05650 [Planctomycetes bacterium]|nr:hypothetical protein [Planctomycetota bacterium]